MTALQDLLQKADSYKEKLSASMPIKKEAQKSLDDSFYAVFGTAYDFMLESAKQPDMEITEKTFQKLHALFMEKTNGRQAGQYRTESVFCYGAEHTPPAYGEIPRLMKHLADQIRSSQSTLHPIELAAMAHKRLLDIQPFAEGNKPVAELLMNLILVKNGYCVTSIPAALQEDYWNALSASRRQRDIDPFSRLIAQCVIEAEQECCRLLGL